MSDEEKVDGEKYKERGKDLNSAGDHPKWLRECGPRRSRAPKGRELDPPGTTLLDTWTSRDSQIVCGRSYISKGNFHLLLPLEYAKYYTV